MAWVPPAGARPAEATEWKPPAAAKPWSPPAAARPVAVAIPEPPPPPAGFLDNVLNQLVGGYHEWRQTSNQASAVRLEQERRRVEQGDPTAGAGDLQQARQREQGTARQVERLARVAPEYAARRAERSETESAERVQVSLDALREQASAALVDAEAHRLKGEKQPLSPVTEEFLDEKSIRSGWQIFWSDPARIITDLGVRSLPQMLEPLAAGASGARVAGLPGFAAGMGAGSARLEIGTTIVNEMRQRGVDMTSATAIAQFLSNDDLMRDIQTRAMKRGVTIGGVDALSSMFGGTMLTPFRNTIMRHSANVAAQAALQTSMGAGGEALGQLAEGRDELAAREIAAEAAGELVTAPIEVAGAAASAASDRARGQPAPAAGSPPPGPAAPSPEEAPDEAAAAAPAEPVERYQFMRNPREGVSVQMEVLPLTQERFIKYVRPYVAEGYANTLEEYVAKHPGVTHVALTRRGADQPWKFNWVDSSEGIIERLRRNESRIRQVKDFESPEAAEWAAIDETEGARRDPSAIDPKTDSLLAAIAKMGGLSREEAEKSGIDPAEFGRRGSGIKLVFAEKGLSAEDMAERLEQRGYPVTAEGTYSGMALLDRVHDELAGRRTRTDQGMEQSLEEEAAERGAAEERRYREQGDAVLTDYGDSYEGIAPVERTLGEPTDYPEDFDQQARNLADLATMARDHVSEEEINDALMAGSDAQAARELWEIVNRARPKPSQPKQTRTEPTPADQPVAAAEPEGERAGEEAAPVTWETIKPGQQVTLYRGESRENAADGEWWTTNRAKAEKYGTVSEATLPAEVVGRHAARGHYGADEFVFPNKRPPELARERGDEQAGQQAQQDASGDRTVRSEAGTPAAEGRKDARPPRRRRAAAAAEAPATAEDRGGGPDRVRVGVEAPAAPAAEPSRDDARPETTGAVRAAVPGEVAERLGQLRDTINKGGVRVGKTNITDALAALERGDTEAAVRELENASQALFRQHAPLADVADEIIEQLRKPAAAPAPKPGPTKKEIDEAAHEAATSPKNALPQPTQAQKEAENYKVGDPVTLYGVTWRVENPKGSYRFKFDEKTFSGIFADMLRGIISDREYQRVLDLLRGGRVPEAFTEANNIANRMRAASNEEPRMRKYAKRMESFLERETWFAKLAAHYARAVGVPGADGDTLDAFIGPQAADQSLPVFVFDTNKLDGEGFEEHKVMLGFPDEAAARKTFRASYNGTVADKILAAVTPMSPAEFASWIANGDLKKPAAESNLKAETADERAKPQAPESGQPAGAQPEAVPPSGADEAAGHVRGDAGEGGGGRAAQPDTAWLHDGRGLGSGARGVLETAGQGALDFALDRRPERDPEPRVDGRSAEVKRAKETGSISAGNYVITADDAIGKGGVKTKAKQNIAAIRIVKALQEAKRAATSEEQAALVKYVGWGGIPQIFDADHKDWTKEHAELKALLTADEYAAARRSTQDAHYTSETVVRAMYTALERLGFHGGKVLEPAAGVGHFFGMMPENLSKRVQAAGVELDPLTAQIAQALYPKIRVAQQGFQDFAVPDGYYDVVIGNPPFGDQKLFDGERKHLNDFSIHNYFIAKAVEVTRPGGVVAVVVSRYFMDSTRNKAREYIAGKAKLLGAIRLPKTAFMDNANTEVVTDIVTDIVFLQRLEEGQSEHRATWWREPVTIDEGNVNPYFIANPRMVAGKHATTGSMYKANEYTVEPTDVGGTLAEQIQRGISLLPENVIPERAAEHQAELEKAAAVVDVDPSAVEHVQVFGYFERDGQMFQRLPDQAGATRAEAVEIDGASKDRLRQLIKVRDLVRAQLRMELADHHGMDANRKKLNAEYDRLVGKYGYVHSQGNKNVFSDDPAYPLLLSLEVEYDRGISATTAKAQGVAARKPSAHRAAIFTRRVLVPFHAVDKVTSAEDALSSSLAEKGRIDPEYIERIYGKPFADVMTELGDRVYESTDGSGWVTADEYLSGNVKAALKDATAAAKRDARFARNAQALARVIPADLDPVDIDISAASPWIPANYMVDFATHLFGPNTKANIVFVPAMGKFSAKVYPGDRVLAQAKWGTERVVGNEILETILTNGTTVVYDRMPDGGRQINQEATLAAQDKTEQIKREFEDWIWKDEARRTKLAALYNDTFNTDVERVYDGSHLGRGQNGAAQPLRGASPEIQLRPHQKNYVWRFVQSGKSLADHVVGAGKTFAAITAVMERRRLGLIHKPLFVVPNHLTEQWGGDFTKLYPGAKVLVATKKDFEKANRRKFFAKIATGDWDAVVIAHSSFERIAMPLDALERFVAQQVADLTASQEALRASDSRDKRSIKQMEKSKERLQAKLEARAEGKDKDDTVALDELGVDALIVDEAHAYKNLTYSTSRRNVAGLGNTEGSERAMDMFVKSQYILERNGDQNLMYLTGTPISNSIAEMYHVQRYMDSPRLRRLGLYHFDSWANTFASLYADWEVNTSGIGMKQITRFRRFQNFAELMKMYREFADVVTQDDLKKMRAAEGKPSLTPPIAGGGPQAVVVPASPAQRLYMAEIVKRAENIKANKNDNMLLITTHARQAALDMRLRDPAAADDNAGKASEASRRIKGIYDKWTKLKGTQLVFIDLSTPKSFQGDEQRRIADILRRAEEFEPEAMEQLSQLTPDEIASAQATFDVYNDLKAKLVALGIPDREIEFIHQANTELRKEALFERMRQGVTRVLLGSTPKMGAGMNVQRRLVALHHLDAPWKPSDLEQRDGRIVRQGNIFYDGDSDRGIAPIPDFAVEILRYVTKGTYDARGWQVLENKARFIGQMRSASLTDRRVEDIGGEVATAAAMKAAASDNPLIEEEIRLRGDIRKLEIGKREHTRKEHTLEAVIRGSKKAETEEVERTALFDQDIAATEALPEKGFAGLTLRGAKFTDKKKAGMAVAIELAQLIKNKQDSTEDIGRYRGFDFSLELGMYGGGAILFNGKAGNYRTAFEPDQPLDPIGIIQRLDNLLARIPEHKADHLKDGARRRREVESARGEVGKPFEGQAELDAKTARHREVLQLLSKKAEDDKATPASDISPSYGDGRRGGLGVKVIEPFIRPIVNAWKGLPAEVIVTTRRDLSRVPEHVKRGIESLDPTGRMMGANWASGRTIYLFADNLPSLMEAERILIHEAKGHAGVEAYLGEDFPRFRDLALRVFKKEAVQQAMHTHARLNTVAGRNRVGQEIIASIAERVEAGTATSTMLKFWDWLVEAVLKTLRSLGFKHAPTPAELRNVIREAARRVETGPLAEGSRVAAFTAPARAAKVDDITAALTDPKNEPDLKKQRAAESARKGKEFLERVLKDGQPVDEAFAQLMRPFGTLDERRVFHVDPRAKVYARLGMDEAKKMLASKKFTWLRGPVQRAHNLLNERYNVDEIALAAVETVKRGMIDRYGQSEAFRERSLQVEADRRSILLQGEDLLKRLLAAGVESKEAEVMYRMMTVDGASPEERAELGKEIEGLAPEIREAIDHMGREYVELGLLDAATFEYWRATYLPRSYLKYEQERGSLAKMVTGVLDGRRKRIIGRQFRQRGIEIVKSQARVLKDIPEDWWGRRLEKNKADAALIGEKLVVLERVVTDDLAIDMPGMDPKKVEERVTSRIYWPADLPIPPKWAGYENRGTFEVTGTHGGDVTLWRDWDREERERMTEIVDVRYAIAKAYMQAANDIANGRFFRDIAQNQDWASKTDPAGNSPEASERVYSVAAGADWVRVPETKVAGSNTAKYGALAGMYVRAEIWNDVNQTMNMQKPGFWKAIMTTWKLNKTARNPVVHFNNIASNMFLMDLVDVRARDLVRGLRSYVEEDSYYRSALEHGAFGADIVTQELKNTLLGPVMREIEREAIGEQAGLFGVLGRIYTALRALDQKMIAAYRLEDEVFRMATYMREIERGATPAEAAAHAREQFLNYDIRAPWINAARQTVLPFIAYTYRAVPVVAKALYNRPWKLAKYYTLAFLYNAFAYWWMDDDDEDEQRATLRDEEQGRTWLGVPRMLRAPANDRFGNPIFWDTRRLIPAGDVFDTNQGSSAIAVPAPLQFGGPLMIGFEWALNKQGFTGEPITNKLTDTPGERRAKVADFLWKSVAPSAPWVPGSWYWSKIEAAATGELDSMMREYSVPLAISSSIGLKLRPHDVNLERNYRMLNIEAVQRALDEQLRGLSTDLARRRIDREFYDEQIAAIEQKLLRLNEQAQELAPR